MDAILDPQHEADPRSSVQDWFAERRRVEAREGGHQRRFYATHTYCDDNLVVVVGVPVGLHVYIHASCR